MLKNRSQNLGLWQEKYFPARDLLQKWAKIVLSIVLKNLGLWQENNFPARDLFQTLTGKCVLRSTYTQFYNRRNLRFFCRGNAPLPPPQENRFPVSDTTTQLTICLHWRLKPALPRELPPYLVVLCLLPVEEGHFEGQPPPLLLWKVSLPPWWVPLVCCVLRGRKISFQGGPGIVSTCAPVSPFLAV